MRHFTVTLACLAMALGLAGCGSMTDRDIQRAVKDVNAADEANLNEIMLAVGDPDEAVAYFRGALDKEPDRIDLMRNLATSLVRARKPVEGARVWERVAAHDDGTDDDKVMLADALIRANDWSKARATLNSVPPTHESYDRYRLEAMIADSEGKWTKADSFYETAAGLTTRPASVLNNWGYSKLTRKDYAGAEKLFIEALTYDPGRFTAKNNLALARAAQRKYDLPVIDMTQKERAELLYTLGLAAIKQGDVNVGKSLLEQAIDTHPQHFEAAARSLAALDANVARGG